MSKADPVMTLQEARALLGVPAFATAGEVRRAFRDAAKRLHPDRPGGSPEAFHRLVEAYQRLKDDRIAALPAPCPMRPEARSDMLSVSAQVAYSGGVVEHTLADGRRIKVTLPAGVRQGEKVAVAGELLFVEMQATPEICVRGDDVWISITVSARTRAEGGRVAVDTPLGRRIVWISRKDCKRGLLRLTNQGLPPRGDYGRGHLFLRLTVEVGAVQSSARTLLDRFAAAWAA